MQALNRDEIYTYEDYASWNDDTRYELIDGKVYSMAPAPSPGHQSISVALASQLYNYLQGKSCQVFTAPIDVRLSVAENDDTVVQPDIIVVRDRSKIDNKGCKGAPDMIIEIVSPSSGKHDKVTKFNKYLQAGVREYWIVDPPDKALTVHVLEDGKYVTSAYGETDTAPVNVLEGCMINLADVFAQQ